MRKDAKAIMAVAAALFLLPAAATQAQDALGKGKDLLKGLAGGKSTGASSTLSSGELSGGLRDALRVGSERVVGTLGKTDGFNKSTDVHIPLPGSLKTAQSLLGKVGMGGLGDDLEMKLNRAAEAAVPQAKTLFSDAITTMSVDDAAKIVNGPKDAATQYFRQKMSAPLAAGMKPIVDGQLANVGAVAALDKMMGQYKTLPMAPKVQANLTDYVVEKAIDGVFVYLAREEAAIRENPAKRTTELLQKVFK